MTATFAGLAVLGWAVPAFADQQPICADRPTKGTSPCTVDAGHWQVEVDAADLTYMHADGVTTDLGVFASANIKYGVGPRLDLELNITPLQTQRVTGDGAGGGHTSGFGDMVARAKLALTSAADPLSVSLVPYVKLPTAGASLGNGAVESGLVTAISAPLPNQLTLSLTPELDLLENASGQGRHLAAAASLGLSRPLNASLTGSVELWASENADPDGRVAQASFDLGLAWIPVKDQNLQLDGGVNLGVTRQTGAAQFYVGVSRRF